MTTRPRLKLGSHLLPGLAAVALFGVFAGVFLAAPIEDTLGAATGYAGVGSITAAIGYAMFDLPAAAVTDTGTESFLVVFEIIDVVLVAALVAAVMLARREASGEVVTALGTNVSEEESTADAGVAPDGSGDATTRSDGGDR